MLRGRWILVLLVMTFTLPVQAQESAARDPVALARRLLGVDIPYVILEPVPLHEPGDTRQFLVNKTGSDTPTLTTATLVASSANLYLWVEDGISFNVAGMQQMAGQLTGVWQAVRRFSPLGTLEGASALLPLPDVDNDPHLSILFAADIDDGRDTIYNPNNSLARQYAPGEFSDQGEILVVNVSKYPGTPLFATPYLNILVRAMYHIVADYHTPGQATWLKGALSWYIANQVQTAANLVDNVDSFLQAPNTALMASSGTAGSVGAQQLFLQYVRQRIGVNRFTELFKQTGDGMAALDALLERNKVTDPNTGLIMTGRDLFADFVVTNMVNRPFGDGRYFHLGSSLLEPGRRAGTASLGDLAQFSADSFSINQLLVNQGASTLSVNQFGTVYVNLTTTQPMTLTLGFNGAETANRLPMPADSGRFNHFYWSGQTADRDYTLTQTFDLTRVSRATLTFDAWYNLANQWNYAYLMVSADGGETWDILPATTTTAANGSGAAYGPGFTGISNPEKPRPFPYLGINFDPATGGITQIVPDGPVSATEIEIGDLIIGYAGEPWANGVINLLGALANYEAGDTMNLLIQRGSQTLDVPVVLGEHPVNRFVPVPLWQREAVDLSAYTGQSILVRFEYISLPGAENSGIAIDNIAIPEIGFKDDAESVENGWTMLGWQRITNQVPQRFLLQVATVSPDTIPVEVRRLIGPADDATSGQWKFRLEPGEVFYIAVSGLNDNTSAAAPFDLVISRKIDGPDL